MALKVGELFALFTIDSSGVTRGMNNISLRLTQMSTEFQRAGLLWTSAITRPIVNAGKESVQKSMEFSKEMAKTYAKTGIDINTEDGQAAMEALETTAQDVAKRSVYTMVEVAGAYDKMAMAGWDYRSMLGGLEPIMDLAAASGEDVVRVSDIVTDAMTAFGLTFENSGYSIEEFQKMVEHFSDVLSTAATSSNTDVSKMGESFKYAATMAGTMNYSIDDIAVALGLMANRGTKASQAGTSLRRMLQVLVAPTGETQNDIIDELGLTLQDSEGKALSFLDVMLELRSAFDGLNIDVDEYSSRLDELGEDYLSAINWYAQWEKAGGVLNDNGTYANSAESKQLFNKSQLKDYLEYLDEVEKLNKQLVDSQQNDAALTKVEKAARLFGPRGMLSLLSIVQSSDEEFNSLVEAIEGSEGRTHEMKETMLDNSMGKLEMFQSSVDVLKTQIGDLINQSLTPMIEKATEVVDKFINMDDETKESILTLVGVAAAIGPVLIGVGLLMRLLPGLASAFSFLASPLGIVTALLAALAISALDTDGKLGKAFDGIGEMLGIDMSGFSLEDLDIDGMLDGLLGGIGELADNPAVTGFMSRLGEGLVGALGSLGDIAGQIIGYILSPEGLSKLWEAGQSLGNLLLDGIGYALGGIFNFFGNLIDRVLVSWGILSEEDLENKKKQDQQVKLGESYRKQMIDDFAKGFTNAETNEIDKDQIAESLIEAIMLNAYGGNYDTKVFEQLAATMKERIQAAMGEGFGEITDSEAAYYLEDMISRMWDNLMWAAKEAREDEEIDFTGANVKEAMGGLLDSLGIGADKLSDEVYETIAEQLKAGDLEDENSLLGMIFDWLFNPDAEPEEKSVEEIKNEAVEAARNTVEEVTDELGKPDTIEKAAEQASVNGVTGMETALLEGKDTVGQAAAEVSDEAVRKFLLTMSDENGLQIGLSYTNAIIDGMRDAGIIAVAASIADSVHYVFSTLLSWERGYSIGYVFGSAIADGMAMAIGVRNRMPTAPRGMSNSSEGTSEGSTDNGMAERVAGAVAAAIGGAGVYMDGVKVGNIVTPTVSQNIAREAAGRFNV